MSYWRSREVNVASIRQSKVGRHSFYVPACVAQEEPLAFRPLSLIFVWNWIRPVLVEPTLKKYNIIHVPFTHLTCTTQQLLASTHFLYNYHLYLVPKHFHPCYKRKGIPYPWADISPSPITWQTRDTNKEGTSIEELPLSRWPVSVFVGAFSGLMDDVEGPISPWAVPPLHS